MKRTVPQFLLVLFLAFVSLLCGYFILYLYAALYPGYYEEEVTFLSPEITQQLLGIAATPRRMSDKEFCDLGDEEFSLEGRVVHLGETAVPPQLTDLEKRIYESADKLLFRTPGGSLREYNLETGQINAQGLEPYRFLRPNVLTFGVDVQAWDFGFFKVRDIYEMLVGFEEDGTPFPILRAKVTRNKSTVGVTRPNDQRPASFLDYEWESLIFNCPSNGTWSVRPFRRPKGRLSYYNGRLFSHEPLGDDPWAVLRSLD